MSELNVEKSSKFTDNTSQLLKKIKKTLNVEPLLTREGLPVLTKSNENFGESFIDLVSGPTTSTAASSKSSASINSSTENFNNTVKSQLLSIKYDCAATKSQMKTCIESIDAIIKVWNILLVQLIS